MSKLLATLSAIGLAALIVAPGSVNAREQAGETMKNSESIEVSSARRQYQRYHRQYSYRPYYRNYGYRPYYRSSGYRPYYRNYGYSGAYGYDPYYYRPYYRPGISVGVGPFGFGFGY